MTTNVKPVLGRTAQSEPADLWLHRYQPATGDVIFDVGAGRGVATVVFSPAVGETGRIFAVEPHPWVYRRLEDVIRRRALRNTRAIRCAVTDRAGVCELTDLENYENNTVRTESETCNTIEVESRTIDQLVRDLGVQRLDFLKMNIEGAERLAIHGMGEALSGARAVAIACHDFVADLKGDDWFRTSEIVSSFLEERGFKVARRSSDARVFVRDYVYGYR
jgi:FkbM family methyltransferase